MKVNVEFKKIWMIFKVSIWWFASFRILLLICGLIFCVRNFAVVTSEMAINARNRKSNIFGNILDFLFIIPNNSNLEEFQIFTMSLKWVHVSFHHAVNSFGLFSSLDLSFLEVDFDSFFWMLWGMFEIKRYDRMIFRCHYLLLL